MDASTDDSQIVSRAWDFGDPASGASNASTDPNPQHSYAARGNYRVTLRVTDDEGLSEPVEGNVPNPRTDFYCWTPNDGFYVDMHATGHVFGHDYEEQLQGAYPRTNHVLGFGQRWARPEFRCVSRRSGLTCRNDAKHGWWLGRFRGYRVF
jgi:hypothetical protein